MRRILEIIAVLAVVVVVVVVVAILVLTVYILDVGLAAQDEDMGDQDSNPS